MSEFNSKAVPAVHKPHTLPLISHVLCGDIWLTVRISVLEFVHRVYLFLYNPVLRASVLDRLYTDAVRPQ